MERGLNSMAACYFYYVATFYCAAVSDYLYTYNFWRTVSRETDKKTGAVTSVFKNIYIYNNTRRFLLFLFLLHRKRSRTLQTVSHSYALLISELLKKHNVSHCYSTWYRYLVLAGLSRLFCTY